jgi:hypothetical protein
LKVKVKKGIAQVIKVMKQRYDKLKELITYDIETVDLLYDDGNVWIYNKIIKKEVDLKYEYNELNDILRYSCAFPSGPCKIGVTFYYNKSPVWSMGGNNINAKQIEDLRASLDKYKEIPKIIEGKVTLQIDYK